MEAGRNNIKVVKSILGWIITFHREEVSRSVFLNKKKFVTARERERERERERTSTINSENIKENLYLVSGCMLIVDGTSSTTSSFG